MRLIDADELLDMLFRADLDYEAMGGVNYCIDKIEGQPTVEIPQWIPCSERLPRENERVIACNENGLQMIGKLSTCFCGDNGEEFGITCASNKNLISHVIAWQPLPKPYKGE